MRFVSSIIPASSAGTVPLGGAADVGASKLVTGVPNKARTALGGSIHDRCSAYWGCAGAGCWYCGKQVHKVQAKKVHIVHALKTSQNDRYVSLNYDEVIEIGADDADTAKVRFVSSIIPVSSAGTVPLGGAADVDASKLETGDPNKARTALGGSFLVRGCAGGGHFGAGHWYHGNSNQSNMFDMLTNDTNIVMSLIVCNVHKVHTYGTSKQGTYSTSKQGTYRTSKQGT